MTDLREWVATARAERWGIVTDLAFAIAWVTVVDVIFRVLEGPTWAYYMFMLSGVLAYYLLVINYELATDERG